MPRLLEPLLAEMVKTRLKSGATVSGAKPSMRPASVSAPTPAWDELSKYVDGICRAIVAAHDDWRQRARLSGVQINGATATGGSIVGPSLADIVALTGPSKGLSGNAPAHTRAIADGLAACWRDWERSVRVPRLPWYPSFAAFPGPQAPPVANVPMPMSSLTWSSASLSPGNLKANMVQRLKSPAPYSDALIASVAEGFSATVDTWFRSQLVVGVLAKGPVVGFAPPYVPVAPVVGGISIDSGPNFST